MAFQMTKDNEAATNSHEKGMLLSKILATDHTDQHGFISVHIRVIRGKGPLNLPVR
jgi:hypothetical protein